MKTLQLGQTYQTRDGKGTGRVVCVDAKSSGYPCVVLVSFDHGEELPYSYYANGAYSGPTKTDPWDLIIPERKMRTVWLNVYKRSDGECDAFYNEQTAREDAARMTVCIPIAIAYPVEVPAE